MTGEQIVIAGVIGVMALFVLVLGGAAFYSRDPGPTESRKLRHH